MPPALTTYEVRAVHGRVVTTRQTLAEAKAYADAKAAHPILPVPGLTVHEVTRTSEQVYPAPVQIYRPRPRLVSKGGV